MKLTKELFLMNKQRSRLKRFRKYQNMAFKENYYMEIDFAYIIRTSTKPAWKGSKIETVEDGNKEYEEILKEGRKKTNFYARNFKNLN